jgi:hypothetical protein
VRRYTWLTLLVSLLESEAGGLAEVPIGVPGHGPKGFQPREATASLEAIISDSGTVLDHQRWTREVNLITE